MTEHGLLILVAVALVLFGWFAPRNYDPCAPDYAARINGRDVCVRVLPNETYQVMRVR